MMSTNTIRRTRALADAGARDTVLVPRPIRRLAEMAKAAWIRHRDEKLLQGLSDHQLRDLGIGRGEIRHVARHGRDW